MGSCPSGEQLRQLLSDRLAIPERQLLEVHVEQCSACEQALLRLCEDGEIETWRRLVGCRGPSLQKDFLVRLKDFPQSEAREQTKSELPLPSSHSSIGKYRLIRKLAAGAYGEVYEGLDPQMDRRVAIKVPTAALLETRQAREQFLREARCVANLRHPNIVAVHDFGQEPDGRCYLVYDFINGTNLAEVPAGSLSPLDATRITAATAEALHYAHLQGLFHRDIKPANILLDGKGRPYVTDFGIAVREEDLLRERGNRSGTPHYMSPEQVRCEGHLIDGRTDIYSLGVVFYELLTGQRPFKADTIDELYELILRREIRPPRQINDAISRELERICLKAVSKRITDRYTTAHDMAEELRQAVGRSDSKIHNANCGPRTAESPLTTHHSPLTATNQGTAAPRSPFIIPKGLRSFGLEDAEFYLQLLPGPVDRDGLPEAIRFWKVRVESTETDTAFRVGLIHGPSGCGKTSLIRAGLLPRLAKHVQPFYVEAVRDGTETRVMSKLRQAYPRAKESPTLAAALAALRRTLTASHPTQEDGGDPARKIVVVIDQLEQWLHTRGSPGSTDPLVAALRQADGCHVQFLLMVRDDFWSGSVRLFEELEMAMDSGKNVRMFDLFDQTHARKVLAWFGQAYGCLPQAVGSGQWVVGSESNEGADLASGGCQPPDYGRSLHLSPQQRAFVQQAVEGLSQDGKVISVRLSLFADMMKSRPWTPESLKAVGGTEGVGVRFLEETFSVSTASPEHRQDEQAARGLLAALLPANRSDIKGQMCSQAELMRAAGLENAPRRFERLLSNLSQELRIITPTEPIEDAGVRTPLPNGRKLESSATTAAYYQLTHDYLVGPLREWLAIKSKETWRGRAELCLEERTASWTRTREARFLPSLWEYVRIMVGVSRKRRKPEQQALLRAASIHHGIRVAVVLAFLSLAGWGSWELHGRYRAYGLAQAICSATPAEADRLIDRDLPAYHRWARQPLMDVATDSAADPAYRLRASLACLPEQVEYLNQRLLDCSVDELRVICNRLHPYHEGLLPSLWTCLRDVQQPEGMRFHAGMALAAFAPQASEWQDNDAEFLVRQLLIANPNDQRKLCICLSPIRSRLLVPLEQAFDDATLGPAAAAALVEYASEDADRLAQLVSRAKPGQYPIVFATLAGNPATRQKAAASLTRLIESRPAHGDDEVRRADLGRRRAQAAIASIRLGHREPALAALRVRNDHESLSQFAVLARELGVSPTELQQCLEQSKEESVRFGLLLALGEYPFKELSVPQQKALPAMLAGWYRNDPSSAIHGACAWVLNRWGLESTRVENAYPCWSEHRIGPTSNEWFSCRIGNSDFSFIVFPPGQFVMGSPDSEKLRVSDEKQRRVRITRSVAVLQHEVTVAQWLEFMKDAGRDVNAWKARDRRRSGEPRRTALDQGSRHPVHSVSWHEAVEYCRWLTTKAGMPESEQCYVEGESSDGTKEWQFRPEKKGFRLSTEAEWEYACRGGTVTTFSFGSDPRLLPHFGVFLEASERQPMRGGSARPNPRGLFDMHGNVWEWCHDWHSSNLMDEEADPVGPPSGKARGYRGGSYDNYARHGRCACRIKEQPTEHYPYLGFRVVCTVASEGKPERIGTKPGSGAGASTPPRISHHGSH